MEGRFGAGEYIRFCGHVGDANGLPVAIQNAPTEGRLPVFNGRTGLELPDNLHAGCKGLILAPDCIDHAIPAYEFYHGGSEAEAENFYRAMLPAAVFTMQGIGNLVCYGKRLFGARAGIDRAPVLRPTQTGLEIIQRFAKQLGALRA